ncbi:threonine aldolase, putative, partial [Ichthyophthirius multifiliis]
IQIKQKIQNVNFNELNPQHIDFRSDTVTYPTLKMRESMYTAKVGDDVYNDDPAVQELQDYAAKLIGKESALFVPSGCLGNTCCLMGQSSREKNLFYLLNAIQYYMKEVLQPKYVYYNQDKLIQKIQTGQ